MAYSFQNWNEVCPVLLLRWPDISILLTRRHTNWLEDIACSAGVEFGDWKAVEVWPGFERVAWCIWCCLHVCVGRLWMLSAPICVFFCVVRCRYLRRAVIGYARRRPPVSATGLRLQNHTANFARRSDVVARAFAAWRSDTGRRTRWPRRDWMRERTPCQIIDTVF